jgi:hypothetical protein
MRHRSLLLTLIAVVIIGSLGALWAGGWLDFATIKAHHNQLAALVRDWPLLSALGFFLGFVLATALSIPIATALSLLAGSLFGLMEALLLVSFASTTGGHASHAAGPLCTARYRRKALAAPDCPNQSRPKTGWSVLFTGATARTRPTLFCGESTDGHDAHAGRPFFCNQPNRSVTD